MLEEKHNDYIKEFKQELTEEFLYMYSTQWEAFIRTRYIGYVEDINELRGNGTRWTH